MVHKFMSRLIWWYTLNQIGVFLNNSPSLYYTYKCDPRSVSSNSLTVGCSKDAASAEAVAASQKQDHGQVKQLSIQSSRSGLPVVAVRKRLEVCLGFKSAAKLFSVFLSRSLILTIKRWILKQLSFPVSLILGWIGSDGRIFINLILKVSHLRHTWYFS